MQRVLVHPDIGEFDEANTKVLKNPDRQEMENAIFWLFNTRKKDDLILFYFSGHGIVDDSKLYLANPSTHIEKENDKLVTPSAVAATVLHDSFNNSKSQHQVIILDCCFSGAIARGMTMMDDGTVNLQEQLGGKGRAILTSSKSTEPSYSTSSKIVEYDNSGLTVYTHYLVEGLEKGVADLDDDGQISVEEFHEYASGQLKKEVPAMTPQIFPVKEGHKILLAKSPKNDPTLKYRKELQTRADQRQGKLSKIARKLLEIKQTEWGISAEEAKAIEDEVLQPYRAYERRLQEYKQTLIDAVQEEYPFSPETEVDFKDYRQSLNLAASDITEIEAEILIPLQREYEHKQSDALSHNDLGVALYKQKNWEAAIAEYRQAIQLDPSTAIFYSNLGLVLKAQNRMDEAIAEYRKAIQLEPNNARDHNYLGVAFYRQKNWDAAVAEYRQAIQFDPNKAIFYSNLGLALEAQNKLDEAIVEYRKAIQLEPNNALSHNDLGVALYRQKNWDAAVTEHRQAIQLEPDNTVFYSYLGRVLEEQDKLDEAIAVHRQAIQLEPNNALVHNYLGIALYKQKNWDAAIAAYRQAIQLDPNKAIFYSNLGLALEAQNCMDEAIVEYRKAIQLQPNKALDHSDLSLEPPQEKTEASSSNELLNTAEQRKAFDFLPNGTDFYALEDGEPV